MLTEPGVASQIEALRAKAVRGELTLEEAREAVKLMRAGRISAAATVKAKKAATAKAPVDVDDLMKGLDDL